MLQLEVGRVAQNCTQVKLLVLLINTYSRLSLPNCFGKSTKVLNKKVTFRVKVGIFFSKKSSKLINNDSKSKGMLLQNCNMLELLAAVYTNDDFALFCPPSQADTAINRYNTSSLCILQTALCHSFTCFQNKCPH